MRLTFAGIALAFAIPSAALAESDGGKSVTAVLEEYDAMVRSGEIRQAVDEAGANVAAFARLKEQALVRGGAASASFASTQAPRAMGN
jgi:hypothetical protein